MKKKTINWTEKKEIQRKNENETRTNDTNTFQY